MSSFRIIRADVIAGLRGLPEASVQCCVTSPPYWGLRDYGIPPSVWGGNSMCRHEWQTESIPTEVGRGNWAQACNGRGEVQGELKRFREPLRSVAERSICTRCNAWRGCLGLEPTPDLFIEHIVEVFRHVRRVLHPSGTLWLNLGDCYCTNPHGNGPSFDPKYVGGRERAGDTRANRTNSPESIGLKSKDLAMIPARVALALQADGWYLRSQIPWLKHNGMPESCEDRPTSMVEYIFLFSKSEDCYYDREAVRIAASANSHARGNGVNPKARQMGPNSRMYRDQDPNHQTPAHLKAKQNRSFSAAVHALVPSRARRNSDWFFASIETYTGQFQGLLVDAAGDPLAMIVNPQPFAVEMCTACETVYAQPDYRKLVLQCHCSDCGRDWLVMPGQKPEKACPKCDSEAVERARVCTCGATAWLSHFATFPERMVEPCILAGTSEHGCCSLCGAPYERIVERVSHGDAHPNQELKAAGVHRMGHPERETRVESKAAPNGSQFSTMRMDVSTNRARKAGGEHDNPFPAPHTLGWRPTCSHPLFPAEIVPCRVLDPFAGSGRTGLAAVRLGRDFDGIEISPAYAHMAEWQYERTLKGEPDECSVRAPQTVAPAARCGAESATGGTT